MANRSASRLFAAGLQRELKSVSRYLIWVAAWQS